MFELGYFRKPFALLVSCREPESKGQSIKHFSKGNGTSRSHAVSPIENDTFKNAEISQSLRNSASGLEYILRYCAMLLKNFKFSVYPLFSLHQSLEDITFSIH